MNFDAATLLDTPPNISTASATVRVPVAVTLVALVIAVSTAEVAVATPISASVPAESDIE